MSPSSSTEISRKRLWFCVLAPMLAWSVHVGVSVPLVINACQGQHSGLARALVLSMGAVALLVAAASGYLAYGSFRRLSGGPSPFLVEGAGQDEMLAIVGVWSSLLFAIGVIWAAAPGLMLGQLCEAGR